MLVDLEQTRMMPRSMLMRARKIRFMQIRERLKADGIYNSDDGRTHVLFCQGVLSFPFHLNNSNKSGDENRAAMYDYLAENGLQGRIEELGRGIIFDAEHETDAYLLYLAFA